MLSSICRFGHSMRRHEREIKDIDQIKKFLKEQPYGVLSMCENNVPYGIPLCYGFTWDKNKKYPTFYFHGATTGRKIATINNNPLGCLSISKPLQLSYTSGKPVCTATMFYESIIAEGKVEIVTHKEEIKAALDTLLQQFDVPLGKYAEASLKRTAIIKLVTDNLTMKSNVPKDKA